MTEYVLAGMSNEELRVPSVELELKPELVSTDVGLSVTSNDVLTSASPPRELLLDLDVDESVEGLMLSYIELFAELFITESVTFIDVLKPLPTGTVTNDVIS